MRPFLKIVPGFQAYFTFFEYVRDGFEKKMMYFSGFEKNGVLLHINEKKFSPKENFE